MSAESVTRGKPDPQPYLAGAALLAVDPANVLVFEDSLAGGAAAEAAGCTVVAVGDVAWETEAAARVSNLSSVDFHPETSGFTFA